MPEDPPGFLPPGGNYQDLLSYKKSEVVYDFTFRFCEKFLKRGDRTIDQMVQARPFRETEHRRRQQSFYHLH